MKKNRVLAAVLAVTMGLVSLTGCSNTSGNVQGPVQEQAKQNVKPELKLTENDFLVNGESQYVIVIPDEATKNETFASEELQLFIKEASGAELPIVKESENTSETYISVGATKLAQEAKVEPSYEAVLNNGYEIRTVGKGIFLRGYTDIGTRNSVYEFLYQCFEYECYAADEITMVATKDLKLPAFELTIKPSFDWREVNNGDLIRDEIATCRMRFNLNAETYITGHQTHNSFVLINPTVYDYTSEQYKSWFSNSDGKTVLDLTGSKPAQLCYSNEDMQEEYIKNLLKALEGATAPVYLMGMEDNISWCECEKCEASEQAYGTNAAVMIKFANRVQAAVTEWCETNRPGQEPIKMIFFAYYETVVPPVTYDEATKTYKPIDESVVLHEDLGIMYAPIGATYAYTFEHERNADTKAQLEGWSALTDNVFAWVYSLQPAQGLLMYDTFEVMQENYKFLLANGTTAILDQTDHYQEKGNTAWTRAKGYVMSKLQWNVDLNIEELLDDFFTYYYDKAADIMKSLFDEEREWMMHIYQDLGASGKISDNLNSPEYWSYPSLVEALERLDEAYEVIEEYRTTEPERYARLHDRILLESLQYRYLLICNFGTKYDKAELLNMKQAFKTDFERLEITSFAENTDVAELWSSWGIK